MGNYTSKHNPPAWAREYGEMPKHFYRVINISVDSDSPQYVVSQYVPTGMSANYLARKDRVNYRVEDWNGNDVTEELQSLYGD